MNLLQQVGEKKCIWVGILLSGENNYAALLLKVVGKYSHEFTLQNFKEMYFWISTVNSLVIINKWQGAFSCIIIIIIIIIIFFLSWIFIGLVIKSHI